VDEQYAQRLANLRQDLDDVEAAMNRLEDGTYGMCEVCGSQLEADQLESQPVARRCLSCQ
jgi:RNA polymerase-binding transcription factor DksA